MKIHLWESPYWAQVVETLSVAEITNYIKASHEAASRLLPDISPHLNIVIEPKDPEDVVPETHCMGITYNTTHISLSFDRTVPVAKNELLQNLGRVVFHEMTHCTMFAHDPWQPGLMYGIVTEEVATVLERDFANWTSYWGEYKDDTTMMSWYDELKSIPAGSEKDRNYFVNHPDGRRWIVYKTGTWVVDTLLKSGENLFDLMKKITVQLSADLKRCMDKNEAVQSIL